MYLSSDHYNPEGLSYIVGYQCIGQPRRGWVRPSGYRGAEAPRLTRDRRSAPCVCFSKNFDTPPMAINSVGISRARRLSLKFIIRPQCLNNRSENIFIRTLAYG